MSPVDPRIQDPKLLIEYHISLALHDCLIPSAFAVSFRIVCYNTPNTDNFAVTSDNITTCQFQ